MAGNMDINSKAVLRFLNKGNRKPVRDKVREESEQKGITIWEAFKQMYSGHEKWKTYLTNLDEEIAFLEKDTASGEALTLTGNESGVPTNTLADVSDHVQELCTGQTILPSTHKMPASKPKSMIRKELEKLLQDNTATIHPPEELISVDSEGIGIAEDNTPRGLGEEDPTSIFPAHQFRKRYTTTGTLGKGGMAAVLSGEDNILKKPVAIKTMYSKFASDPTFVQRFIQEAEVQAGLGVHPNIAGVQDLDTASKQKTFVMDKIPGENLGDILEKIAGNEQFDKKRTYADVYPLSELLQIFLKVCDGISFAHSEGSIHRDLKPEQIMVGKNGEVYVMDWGLAKRIKDKEDLNLKQLKKNTYAQMKDKEGLDKKQKGLTLEGEIMGTPQYMPPEQANGKMNELTERSDIYSLGAILYEILTKRRPVNASTIQNILFKVIKGNIDPIKKEENVPKELEAITMKALSFKPNDRYGTARALREDVLRYINNQKVNAYDYGLIERIIKYVQNHPGKAVGALASTVFLFGAGVAGTVISSLSSQAKNAEIQTARAEAGKATAEAEVAKKEKEKVELARKKDQIAKEREDAARSEANKKRDESKKLVKHGDLLYTRDAYINALELYNQAEKIDSSNAEIYRNRAITLRDLIFKNFDIDLLLLDTPINSTEKARSSLEILAETLDINKNKLKEIVHHEIKILINNKSKQDLERAIETDPIDTRYRNEFAYLLELLGEETEAEKQYLTAIDIPRKNGEEPNPVIILNLGAHYSRRALKAPEKSEQKKELLEKAIERYSEYLSVLPADGDALTRRANEYNRLGKFNSNFYDNAHMDAQTALSCGYNKAHFELGYAFYYMSKDPKRDAVDQEYTTRMAKEHFEKAKIYCADDTERMTIINTALAKLAEREQQHK